MLNRPEPLVLKILDRLGQSPEQKNNATVMADANGGVRHALQQILATPQPAFLGAGQAVEMTGEPLLKAA